MILTRRIDFAPTDDPHSETTVRLLPKRGSASGATSGLRVTRGPETRKDSRSTDLRRRQERAGEESLSYIDFLDRG